MINKTHKKFANAYTVKELIEELEQFEPDAVVLFAADYGDHGHTTQALPIESVDNLGHEQVIEQTAYSKSGLAIVEYDDANEDDIDGDVSDQFVVFNL